MKATITFDLNDAEDIAKHKLFTHLDSITFLIWKMDEDMRRVIKYDETKSEDYKQAFEDMRQMLRDYLNNHSLSFELFN
jgi:hypothetical protein